MKSLGEYFGGLINRIVKGGECENLINRFPNEGNYLNHVLYTLPAPITGFVLRKKIGNLRRIELQLDPNLHLLYSLGRILYDSFTEDFVLAAKAPRLEYNPNTSRIRENRARYRKQGISRGNLEVISQALVKEDSLITRSSR